MKLREVYFLLFGPSAEKIINLLQGKAVSAEEISKTCKLREEEVWQWLEKALKLGLVLHFKGDKEKKTLYITHIASREITYKGFKFEVIIEFDDGRKKTISGEV